MGAAYYIFISLLLVAVAGGYVYWKFFMNKQGGGPSRPGGGGARPSGGGPRRGGIIK
ncbi:MAG: hypothetical protein HYY17_03785 [Planctomycetes bacterium]|nr:hypothetical protein [Planctomycetota bacterium]